MGRHEGIVVASSAVGGCLGLAIGAVMMLAAWQHNPQESIHGGDSGTAWVTWLAIGAAWTIATAVPAALAFSTLSCLAAAAARRRWSVLPAALYGACHARPPAFPNLPTG